MRTKPQQLGKNVRQSFAKINEVLQMPDLLEVQKNSYQWLLDKGISEVLQDVSPIVDYSGKYAIEFVGFTLDKDANERPDTDPKEKTRKRTIAECKERDVNYAAPFKVDVRLTNRETGEMKQQEIFMGDFPLMTETGTFVINGAERVAVSQLVRSPGMYYASAVDKSGKGLMTAQIIPYRGAWLEYETDMNDIFYVKIDKNRKIPVTVLIRALEESLSTDTSIIKFFGNDPKISNTLNKDGIAAEAAKNNSTPYEEALKEIYKKMRPGEPPLVESAQILLNNLFFDARRYDLSTVGRYKFDKKVALGRRLSGRKLSQPVISPLTGEVLFNAGKILSFDEAMTIENSGVNEAYIYVSIANEEKEIKLFGNGMVDPEKAFGISLREIGINENVNLSLFLEILEQAGGDVDEVLKLAKENAAALSPKHITKDDIYASINYLICLSYGVGVTDDIDHLGNRRVKAVGELLQNQLRIGFSRMDKIIKERMTINDGDKLTPQALINIRPILAAIREFFGSSPLSQFMDQNNPLAELTHKRRLSALGPGGLSRDRASFEVRDVHYTHYGRICPIETPEGPNIGLISYLATYAKINDYGFIEAPYRKIDKKTGKVTDIVEYMTADMEDNFVVAQANEPLDEEGSFINKRVLARDRAEIIEVDASVPDYIDVSPKMVISVATGFIPFLENDDNSRALMGSNMQKQAVPLLVTDSPIVGTGMEYKAAIDSGVCALAKEDGIVTKVSADVITVTDYDGLKHNYPLLKFQRSNQGNCINQNPIVNVGDQVKKGDVLADGPATSQGEIALGKNALIGFMTWEGYNYEDAVLLNENLVRKDVYTSIHIEEYTLEARDTKLGPEEITREIPNVSEDARKNLDDNGIICKGTEVHAGDILVGKVTPKGETELTAEEKLLRAIFGEKAREVRDTSMRLPHGESGVVVDVRVRDRDTDPNNDLQAGVIKSVRVYIAQKRKISVGDKMAGRHGNKGVVSRILPPEDMPFLEDGTPLDIVLNPLGVPSRMNIGQVLEIHLGIAARTLGVKVMTPAFDGAKESDITEMLTEAGFYRPLFAGESLMGKEIYLETVDAETGKVRHELVSADKLADEAWVAQMIEARKLKALGGLSRPVLRGEALTGKKFYEEIVDEETGAKSYELVGEDKLANKAWVAQMIEAKKLRTVDGKRILYDGRTGDPFDNPVTVGIMYYLKLHHLVDDKIHARSTGPYSLVTQQPLGGKAQFGGQRFGEMEVWALEAYGAAYTLQEILTVKSDDVTGRVKTYEAIVKGQNIPTPGVPESFRVLVKELQSLGLDIRVLDEDGEEIGLSQLSDSVLEDGRGYVVEDDSHLPLNTDQDITTEDLGPAVLDEGDEDSLNMVDDEEVQESFANTPDEELFSYGDLDEDDDLNEE